MARPKSTRVGRRERVAVLVRHEPQTVALLAGLAAQVLGLGLLRLLLPTEQSRKQYGMQDTMEFSDDPAT